MHAVTRSLQPGSPGERTDAVRCFDYVDHAKAVGILLIMVGHSPGVPALAHRLIFSFHVPLFYFMSGFLIGRRKLLLDAGRFGYEVLRNLLLPYVLFFAVAYGYWLATRSIGPREAKFAGVPWYEPLRGLADGLGSDLFICPPLWFFPSLIVTSLAFYALRRRLSARAVGLICLGAGVANVETAGILPWRLPWGLDTLGVTLSFYAVGHWLRQANDSVRIETGGRWRGGMALLLLILWMSGALANGAIDINDRQFDGRPLLTIPTALCGIVSLLLLAMLLPRVELSRWLSRHTLMIFPLHPILFNVISGLRKMLLKLPEVSTHDPWLPLIYTGTSLLAMAPLIRLFDRLSIRRRNLAAVELTAEEVRAQNIVGTASPRRGPMR